MIVEDLHLIVGSCGLDWKRHVSSEVRLLQAQICRAYMSILFVGGYRPCANQMRSSGELVICNKQQGELSRSRSNRRKATVKAEAKETVAAFKIIADLP